MAHTAAGDARPAEPEPDLPEPDAQLALGEELPQLVGPGGAEAIEKVDLFLHDVGAEDTVPKPAFLHEVMSGEYDRSKRKATDRLRRVAGGARVQEAEASGCRSRSRNLPRRVAAAMPWR